MRREDRAYGRMAEAYLAIAHYVGVALNYLDGLSRSVVMGSPRPPDLNADDPDRFSTVFASATAFATDDVRKSLEEFARRATQASQGVALVENAAGAARAAPGDEEILRDYQASTVMLKSALVGAHDEGRALVTRINRELRTDVPK